MKIDRKIKGLTLLSLVTFVAIAAGVLMSTQAANVADTVDLQDNFDTQLAVATTVVSEPTNSTDSTAGDSANIVPFWSEGIMGFGGRCRGPGGRFGMGGFGPIEVSEEYKTAITTIAESDSDVQQLLAEGYNVTRVMPIVKSVIDAEGTLTTKATNATVVLVKDTTGIAFVSVDLTQNKVTQIAIHTKTVIEK